jgi:hypothetical protein
VEGEDRPVLHLGPLLSGIFGVRQDIPSPTSLTLFTRDVWPPPSLSGEAPPPGRWTAAGKCWLALPETDSSQHISPIVSLHMLRRRGNSDSNLIDPTSPLYFYFCLHCLPQMPTSTCP